eukprot:PhM_4_TR6278/c0_g1_i1/m.30246/K07756/IP6K, IHPK; inositol-hexakisphosphate 5-kinase
MLKVCGADVGPLLASFVAHLKTESCIHKNKLSCCMCIEITLLKLNTQSSSKANNQPQQEQEEEEEEEEEEEPTRTLDGATLRPYHHKAAGHHEMFRTAPGSGVGHLICKEATDREERFYLLLKRRVEEGCETAIELKKYVAAFKGVGVLVPDEDNNKRATRRFLLLSDVTSGMTHPCVLDLKMGVRQYGLNPPETKRISKQKKTHQTTTGSLGVRLAGMRVWDRTTKDFISYNKTFGRTLTTETLPHVLCGQFFNHDKQLIKQFHEKVVALQSVFERQELFQFFTSSLLFAYDSAATTPDGLHPRLVMIDFAYTYETYELKLERDEQEQQEQEDNNNNKNIDRGYLFGLTSLRRMLEEMMM